MKTFFFKELLPAIGGDLGLFLAKFQWLALRLRSGLMVSAVEPLGKCFNLYPLGYTFLHHKRILTHSATSPNAWRWGVRAASPKGLEKKEGLSLSVSTLSIPSVNREINLENKPQCLPLGYTNVLTFLICLAFVMINPSVLSMAQDAGNETVETISDETAVTAQEKKLELEFKEPEEGLSYEEIFKRPISLDLRDMDVIEALKYLATKAKLNIVTTKTVSGRVTLTVNEIPIKDVFDIMLRANGLAYSKVGYIYYVMTEAEYRTLHGKNFYDMRQVKVFRLKYAIPEQAFSLLDTIKSEVGRVLADPESGNVLIMDTPEKMQEMQAALDEFEKRNVVKVFSLRYAKAKEVEEILRTRLDAKKVGSAKADERNNQIVVQTLPERMLEIEQLVASLDRMTKEVLIDTKIIKIKLSSKLDKGFEWEGIFNVFEQYGLMYAGSTPFRSQSSGWQSRSQFLAGNMSGDDIGAYTLSNPGASTKKVIGENIHVGIVSKKVDFDALFDYLQTLGETQVISNPKIVAVNNQEAKIHVGEKQAYVTTTTTTGQATSTVAEEVMFVDVGIQLSVTPTINDDGFITMKVKPEVSSVAEMLITPTKNQIPIIDTSLTETTVMVKDGMTIIIGGMRKDERTNVAKQTPFLGRIPLLNYFFKSSSAKTDRIELLVLITPHIISGDTLSTGDEKDFGVLEGKEYQGYPAITPQKEILPGQAPQIQPMPYRDYLSLKQESTQQFSIKEKKYGPDEKLPE